MNRGPFASVVTIVVMTITLDCNALQFASRAVFEPSVRRLSVDEYVDKVTAGWIGQLAGAGWGRAVETPLANVIAPDGAVPSWSPDAVRAFDAAEVYVELTFLRTLDRQGFAASSRRAGIDFANTAYSLQHANGAARDNLRSGIAPPDSGHPQFNGHTNDIDYQIEADYAGLIAPGMPNVVIRLGEKFGRLMSYADGVYGGQLIGALYAEAFFETDMTRLVRAALKCIPSESQYHRCISDVLRWHRTYPDDWTRTWHLVNEKYHVDPTVHRCLCAGDDDVVNVDAKINGAYTVIGLLYGGGDPETTMTVAMRCGQSAAGNASNAAGILFTSIGLASLPEAFALDVDEMDGLEHTGYTFSGLVVACRRLARGAVINAGGEIATDGEGVEWFVIPVQQPYPSRAEYCWDPALPSGSFYGREELAEIAMPVGVDLSEAIEWFAPGWEVLHCGHETEPGLRRQLRGRRNVLVTSPLNRRCPCILARTVTLPAGRKSALKLVVGHDPCGDWDLGVRADGMLLLRTTIGPDTTTAGWTQISVDLSPYAGRSVRLELINEPTGWHYEGAYWSDITLQVD